MESKPNRAPLIVIVGETASGKSALAIELAKQFNGEIIAADSRTVYRGMDIATAKPAATELAEVPHHLINIVDPAKPITAADFKRLAQQAIDNITARGKVPFLVGGTGLYIDAVLYDFSFAPRGSKQLRHELQQLSIEELQTRLTAQGLPLPRNERNPRHLIRSLETGGMANQPRTMRVNTLILGLSAEPDDLKRRITQRTTKMLAAGLAQEAESLGKRYGWDAPAMQTIGYREFNSPDAKRLEEIEAKIIKNTLQYAKRQRTWFRRNRSIHWIWKKEEAVDLITTFLNK